jgi:hypothetical protein
MLLQLPRAKVEGVGGVQDLRNVVRGERNRRLTLVRGYRRLRRVAVPRGQLVSHVGPGGGSISLWGEIL